MRWVFVALGVMMVFTGGLWAAQGLGHLEGSPMSGGSSWAVFGSILAGLGIALVISAVTYGRR